MIAIPKNQNTTLTAIDQALEQAQPCDFRDHLGASIIGDECNRKLWYQFRWAKIPEHTARILRLFDRGNREEDVFINLLEAANVKVWSVNPKTGEQWRIKWLGGHFGGSMDGIGKGFVESGAPHVLEFKTHGDKSFKDLQKKGVKASKPNHWAQVQVYMHGSKQLGGKQINRAYYLAVNKNDDQLYAERVRYDSAEAEKYIDKALRIIKSNDAPPRISDHPGWYLCLQCDYRDLCHTNKVAFPSCRTCIHSTPELEIGGWNCIGKLKTLSHADQLEACNDHLYIPDLIPYGDLIDSDGKTFVTYIMGDKKFSNTVGNKKPGYSSTELYNLDPKMIGDPQLEKLRNDFNAKITDENNA